MKKFLISVLKLIIVLIFSPVILLSGLAMTLLVALDNIK